MLTETYSFIIFQGVGSGSPTPMEHALVANVNLCRVYFRRLYWEDTMKFIQEHNLAYDRREISYFVGENHLSDLVCYPYF